MIKAIKQQQVYLAFSSVHQNGSPEFAEQSQMVKPGRSWKAIFHRPADSLVYHA